MGVENNTLNWASAAHCATKAMIQAGIAMTKVTKKSGCLKMKPNSRPRSIVKDRDEMLVEFKELRNGEEACLGGGGREDGWEVTILSDYVKSETSILTPFPTGPSPRLLGGCGGSLATRDHHHHHRGGHTTSHCIPPASTADLPSLYRLLGLPFHHTMVPCGCCQAEKLSLYCASCIKEG